MKEWEKNAKRKASEMTKLEEFTKAALIGLMSADAEGCIPSEQAGRLAVEHAKKTLKALEEE